MQSASDGSHKRDDVILALIKCGVKVRRVTDELYELERPDGSPDMKFLPSVLTYRTVQDLAEDFGADLYLHLVRKSN